MLCSIAPLWHFRIWFSKTIVEQYLGYHSVRHHRTEICNGIFPRCTFLFFVFIIIYYFHRICFTPGLLLRMLSSCSDLCFNCKTFKGTHLNLFCDHIQPFWIGVHCDQLVNNAYCPFMLFTEPHTWKCFWCGNNILFIFLFLATTKKTITISLKTFFFKDCIHFHNLSRFKNLTFKIRQLHITCFWESGNPSYSKEKVILLRVEFKKKYIDWNWNILLIWMLILSFFESCTIGWESLALINSSPKK